MSVVWCLVFFVRRVQAVAYQRGIVKNRSIYDLAGFRAAAENLARLTVYYFMWVHGYPIALATHAALSYFGSGTGESVIQSTVSIMSGGRLTLPTSVLTSLVNSLIRYSGGDRLLSLGLNIFTALITAAINPLAIPAMIGHRITPSKKEKED